MLYLIEFHGLWFAAALLIGAGVGWLGHSPGSDRRGAGWLPYGAGLGVIGAGLALFEVLPGRAGYALDLAVLFFAAYLVGCFIGDRARSFVFGRTPELVVPARSATVEPAPVTPVLEEADRAAEARVATELERRAAEREPDAAEKTANPVAAELPVAEPAMPDPVPETPSEPVETLSAAPVEEPVPAARTYPGRRPPVLAGPLGLGKDDLGLIKGIGPRNEKVLNGLGIFHFCQIADWSAGEAEWVGHAMAFPGRIEREHWIEQAKVLCAGGETEHAEAVRTGRLVRSDEGLSAAEGARLKTALTEASLRGRKPPVLAAPAPPGKDELVLIKGVGPRNERMLNSLGIFHFCQIADWSGPEAEWIGHAMAFPGRVERELWIDQAKVLCRGGETDHARAVRAGEAQPSDAALSAAEAARIRAALG